MTIRIDRRQFLMGTSALVAAGAAGVMPAWAQASNLRLIFWGGQARADRTYAVTDLYKAAKGTEIEGEFLAWNDYWPKLATQTAGGNAPDIIQMDYRYIVEYAKRNAIAPLDEFVGGALKLDGFDADQLEGGKVDGKLYGISLGANSVATLVNTSAFEEAGIEAVELEGAADKFVKRGNGVALGVFDDVAVIHLDDIGGVAARSLGRQLGPVVVPGEELAFDGGALGLGIEVGHAIGAVGTGLAAPEGQAQARSLGPAGHHARCAGGNQRRAAHQEFAAIDTNSHQVFPPLKLWSFRLAERLRRGDLPSLSH